MNTIKHTALGTAAALVLASAVLLPVSCTREETIQIPGKLSDGRLQFSVRVDDGWASLRTKSPEPAGEEGLPAGHTLFSIPDGFPLDTLYLHTSSTRGISAFASAPDTRASQVSGTAFHSAFGLLGYHHAAHQWTNVYSSLTPNFMYKVKASTGTNGRYETDGKYYLPNQGTVSFFAYAPYDAQGLTLSGQDVQGLPVFTYTVPSDPAAQSDLCLAGREWALLSDANQGDQISDGLVNMTFFHALTAVKFVVGDLDECTVKSIAVKGVRNKGTYQFKSTQRSSENHDMADWTVDATGTGDFLLSNLGFQNTASGAGAQITNETQYLMMMPQTVPTGAVIEVVFDQNGTEHTLSASIAGHVWRRGETVTYRISADLIEMVYKLTVEPKKTSIKYYGEDTFFEIASYVEERAGDKVNSKTAVPWTASIVVEDPGATDDEVLYTDQNGKKYRLATDTEYPDIMTPSAKSQIYFKSGSQTGASDIGYTTTGLGTDDEFADPGAYMHISQRPDGTECSPGDTPRDRVLKKNAPESQKDLSKPYGSANCYIVNASGTYKFPAVYGNSLNASGGTDITSYRLQNTESLPRLYYRLQKFADHSNNIIKNPWIATQLNGNSLYAGLLWQDAEGLIKNVSLSSDKKWVSFTVTDDKTKLRQGNAVIYLSESSANGNIVWSWHIWVTNYKDTTVTVGSNEFSMLPLGYIEDDVVEYDQRTIYVLFSQNAAEGLSHLVEIPQEAGYQAIGGSAPYYQWGRKDPYKPALENNNDKQIYYGSRPDRFQQLPAHTSFGGTIGFPMCAYICNELHNQSNKDNGWWDVDACLMNRWTGKPIVNDGNDDYPPSRQDLFLNLWDVGYDYVDSWNATKTIKSVYDPCPPNFCVPTRATMSLLSGGNGQVSYSQKGEVLGIYYVIDGRDFYVPLLGQRKLVDQFVASEMRTNGWYWTSSPLSSSNLSVQTYYANSKGQIIEGSSFMAYGLPIFPVLQSR